jgi:membrane protease YdiL (CAAX protease family)
MNSFLFPKEGRNTFPVYIFSILIILVGTYILGSIVMVASMSAVITFDTGTDFTNLAQYFTKNQYLLINLLPFFVGVLCFFLVSKLLKRPFLSLITSRVKIDWKRFSLAFGFWIFIQLIVLGLNFVFSPELIKWNYQADQFGLLLLIGIFGILLQTLFEELLMRGFFLQFGALFIKKGFVNVLFNSLIFGALHLANPEIDKLGYFVVAYYVISGVFEGIVSVMDDGFELAWGFHFANNFFLVVFFNTTWGALPTDSLLLDLTQPVFDLSMFILPLVTFPLLLFLFSRIYKWENWKSKLF